MIKCLIIVPVSILLVAGCANNEPLGTSVAKLRYEQTYDHNATLNNRDVIPNGTGSRLQVSYDAYTGQSAYDGRAETLMGRELATSRTSGSSSRK
ncbi:hypothetical protein SAMN04488244_109136 [Vibrio hangzhouensis]|uniref:YD repeat-containing protein n=1 Tax=Vibrio hangzhouensis TaxID=462991 RepID=A0A1H5YKA4_9VIBR|nr:hypothetical protein SAMN04488244_109136 [Vibrio hangzhouensis]